MSKVAHAYTDHKSGDELPKEAPEGQVNDSSYKTSKDEAIPVIDDNEAVEDPIRPEEADSDKQLERDDREAIDEANIVKGVRSRRGKLAVKYTEPTDEQMGLTEESQS